MSALRIALAAAVAAAGFSSPADEPTTYKCEARGGSAWREYRTQHFLVATDLSAPRAEAVVRDLEQLHALVVQALVGEQVDVPGKLRVIAFSDPRDFERLVGPHVVGFFEVGARLTPTAAFAADGFQADPEVIAHELAHSVSWHIFPRQPHWFAEGLAQFVQTVGRAREQTAPQLGSHVVRGGRETGGRWAGLAPGRLVGFLQQQGGAFPEDLLGWSSWASEYEADQRYAWSWLLYHWAWNTRSKAFTDFTNRLTNAEEPARAWREAFPDLDPAKPGAVKALGVALEAYRRGGRFASYEVKAPFDARFTMSPLPPAEVHALLVDARMPSMTAERAAAEMAEALREDPLHPVALWHAARTPEERRAAMRKATAGRAGDWRGWYLLASALVAPEERAEKEAALRKAVALNPESAASRNQLAWFLFETGRAKEAIPHANAALDLAPSSPAVIDTLASVASAVGKCKEAGILQRRALDLVRSDDERKGYEKRLSEIEARCAASPAK
jgi:tetratricopeptide (TPR) repeat protein